MIKKTLLTVSSVFILAACSSTTGGHEQGDYITGSTTSGSTLQNPDILSHDPLVSGADDGASKEVLKLRKDFIRHAGDRAHFGFDSSSLDDKAQENLKNIAEFIKGNSDRINSVTIEGHCDERGTREYNLALGDRRAVSAKKYLVGLGIDASMISTISYGKERAVDPRHNEKAWSRNRRAVVVLN